MASIVIGSPGLLSTVQDGGRYGYQRFGMPVSGAMDAYSLQLANLLVGNGTDAAGIEATLTGPDISFQQDGVIAICGADMQPAINGRAIESYKAIRVGHADRLSFGRLVSGCRTYIAFAGGLDVPVVMGSRSTYLRAGLGGWHGRPLQEGDRLPLGKSIRNMQHLKLPDSLLPSYNKMEAVRIIPGPETGFLSSEGVVRLLTTTYGVSPQSDRMGYRLEGEAVKLQRPGSDIISSGIASGTIQLTGSGQPIILMADHQTTGGYARIAVVSSVDLTRVAQLRPGDEIRFSEISVEQSQRLLRERNKKLAGIIGNTTCQ